MRIHIKYLVLRRFSSLVRIQTYLKTRRGSGTKSWAKLFHICAWREERKKRREEGRKSRQAWMVAPKCICTDLSKIGNPCVGDRLHEYPWAQILQAQSEEPRFFPGTLKALCAYHVKTPATSFQRYPLLADASDSSLSPVFPPSPAQHTWAHHEAFSATEVKVVLAPNQLVNPHYILPFFFLSCFFLFSRAHGIWKDPGPMPSLWWCWILKAQWEPSHPHFWLRSPFKTQLSSLRPSFPFFATWFGQGHSLYPPLPRLKEMRTSVSKQNKHLQNTGLAWTVQIPTCKSHSLQMNYLLNPLAHIGSKLSKVPGYCWCLYYYHVVREWFRLSQYEPVLNLNLDMIWVLKLQKEANFSAHGNSLNW